MFGFGYRQAYGMPPHKLTKGSTNRKGAREHMNKSMSSIEERCQYDINVEKNRYDAYMKEYDNASAQDKQRLLYERLYKLDDICKKLNI